VSQERPYLLIDVDFVLNPDFRGTWDGESGDSLRPFAWLDDEQSVIDGCDGSGVKVDPATGLTDADIEKAVALIGRAG
jgi:hypothetical protein